MTTARAFRGCRFPAELFRVLGRFVERPQDRALFGLPPKEQASEQDSLSGEFRAAGPGTETGPI